MKLSRTTLIGLALAVAAVVLACVIFNRSTPDRDKVTGGGKGGSRANSSGSASQTPPPRKTPRPEIVDRKALAAKELELLWARGLSQELVVELDRVSAMKDPEYWREIGPLLIQKAAKEGRPDIANYMLVTSDASPDENLRIQIYASAMGNPVEEIRDTAKLELENITGEEFATGDAALAWLAAHPQPEPEEEEMPEGQ